MLWRWHRPALIPSSLGEAILSEEGKGREKGRELSLQSKPCHWVSLPADWSWRVLLSSADVTWLKEVQSLKWGRYTGTMLLQGSKLHLACLQVKLKQLFESRDTTHPYAMVCHRGQGQPRCQSEVLRFAWEAGEASVGTFSPSPHFCSHNIQIHCHSGLRRETFPDVFWEQKVLKGISTGYSFMSYPEGGIVVSGTICRAYLGSWTALGVLCSWEGKVLRTAFQRILN